MNASIPTKADIQQLKSILDELTTKFRENDEMIKSLKTVSISAAQTAKRCHQTKLNRLIGQIPALSNTIKYLNETTT